MSSMKVKSRTSSPLPYTSMVSPARIALVNLNKAMSGRPQGPYTVKNRSPVVGKPYRCE
ncbi:hypothetical protein D3C71_2066760 [compost metagenome]